VKTIFIGMKIIKYKEKRGNKTRENESISKHKNMKIVSSVKEGGFEIKIVNPLKFVEEMEVI